MKDLRDALLFLWIVLPLILWELLQIVYAGLFLPSDREES